MRLHGLLSFPLTPFTDIDEHDEHHKRSSHDDHDDKVDLAVFAEHLEQQIAAGPAGLFVACGTGEFTALSPDEYREVIATAVRVADGRLPVVAGCGGGPRMAREFAVTAAECGADGLLLLPPYLISSTPAGLVGHIRYVASGTELPITVYQRANAVLDEAAALALLDIPTVTGIKDGRGDVDAMLRLVTAIRSSGHPRAAEFGFLNGLPTAELSVQAYAAIGVECYSSAVLCFAPTSPPPSTSRCAPATPRRCGCCSPSSTCPSSPCATPPPATRSPWSRRVPGWPGWPWDPSGRRSWTPPPSTSGSWPASSPGAGPRSPG
ncbi:dihydrodipicolinate synthase family protein [Streptomyces sp. AP-93]|uniref:dihydrodipicolinate synthase family protein n=1 Tax=Streptomyces sp. AP-93 TaxID=2929048 RepID=UPI0027E3D86F|nr:dihydrodipicolinate synthase family protein [Streptomyces sp. AP-93]